MDPMTLKRQAKGFDRLAKGYDLLVALVYGRSLRKAQSWYLERVKPGSKVLILGGGTGWFLEELLRTGRVAEVDYVELSGRMLELSQKRVEVQLPQEKDRVNWILGTVYDLEERPCYDLICTLCFLDLFEGEELESEVQAIIKRISPQGNWYFSVFCRGD